MSALRDLPRLLRDRAPIALAMVIALAAVLAWLQGRFDSSDVQKGIALALRHRPREGGPSVFEALAALGQGDPRCDGALVSTWFGDVRVSCATPARRDVHYEFRVLLEGRRAPKAESAAAQALVAELAGTSPAVGADR
jgi:hypothetical protein